MYGSVGVYECALTYISEEAHVARLGQMVKCGAPSKMVVCSVASTMFDVRCSMFDVRLRPNRVGMAEMGDRCCAACAPGGRCRSCRRGKKEPSSVMLALAPASWQGASNTDRLRKSLVVSTFNIATPLWTGSEA